MEGEAGRLSRPSGERLGSGVPDHSMDANPRPLILRRQARPARGPSPAPLRVLLDVGAPKGLAPPVKAFLTLRSSFTVAGSARIGSHGPAGRTGSRLKTRGGTETNRLTEGALGEELTEPWGRGLRRRGGGAYGALGKELTEPWGRSLRSPGGGPY